MSDVICLLEADHVETDKSLAANNNGGRLQVPLPHGVPVTLGRSIQTGITDVNLSRTQLILTADCQKSLLSIKQVGKNQSGVNGLALESDVELFIKNNDHIELLLNQYVFVVKFIHSKDENKNKKRSLLIEDKKSNKKQKIAEETPVKDMNKLILTNGSKSIDLNSDENLFEKLENGLLYVFTHHLIKASTKIAAYDIDGTLIKTKSGNKFPKDVDDWQLAFPEVPGKLKEYHNSGYKIVLFTNQASIGNGKLKPEAFKRKVENILKRIGVPAQAFISTGYSKYRKPSMGMWEVLQDLKNDKLKINMTESFYCGDAAGRKNDHSFADKFFAENLNIKFFTPEQHFRGYTNFTYKDPSFDPKLIEKNITNPTLHSDRQEILVFVGFPGCGKSTIAQNIEEKSSGKYKSVCRDVLGSWQKCVVQAEKLIKMGKSVVVDSTNLDIESRNRWISLAKHNNIKCRCVLFDVTFAHCKHNNLYRQQTDRKHVIVSDIVLQTSKGKYKPPEKGEGFSDIVKVKFVPKFKDSKAETLYYKHFLDK